MRRLVAVVVPIGLAVLMAGCSSSTPKPVVHPPSTGKGVAHSATVGATVDLTTKSNRPFSVTVSQVIDPAQGAGSAVAASGDRLVGVVLTINDLASMAVNPQIKADVILVGPTNQVYTPSDVKLSECSAFASGRLKVSPAKSVTGCASFEVPTSVTIGEVQFLPTANTAGDYGEWTTTMA